MRNAEKYNLTDKQKKIGKIAATVAVVIALIGTIIDLANVFGMFTVDIDEFEDKLGEVLEEERWGDLHFSEHGVLSNEKTYAFNLYSGGEVIAIIAVGVDEEDTVTNITVLTENEYSASEIYQICLNVANLDVEDSNIIYTSDGLVMITTISNSSSVSGYY